MLEVRYAKRREPRVRARNVKAGVARKRGRLLKSDARAAVAVLDLSASGLKLVVGLEPEVAKGDELLVELLHPSFRGAVLVESIVRWVRAETSDRRSIGVAFARLDERARRQLDRLIALELGSTVSFGGKPVGYLARGVADLAGVLFAYDLDRHELARIVRGRSGYETALTHASAVEHHRSDALEPLLARVFGGTGALAIEPPL